MMYRLLLFLLVLSACQRKSIPDHHGNANADIDTSAQLLTNDKIPKTSLADVHHLLRMGYEKVDKVYDSIVFQLYYNFELQDSIRIQASGNDTVYLFIGNKQNRSVALYSYLDLLGYRFYGPENHWTYIPTENKNHLSDTTVVSHFKYRILSPSYGVRRHNIPRLDTTGELFSRWTNRLRMGNLIQLPAGHYGSTFNRKYKTEIEAHPTWRGIDINGNPKPWHQNLKLCYSHPEVINLYKKDAELRLRNLIDKSGPPYILSMEPPDGDGFCQCVNCRNHVSDQVYSLANIVAKHINNLDSNAMVSLYGYNEHAAAPSFPLEKNVIVGIVPYAFQNIGSPEVMMNDWESTGATLYLRDYLAIPDWSFDRPSYHPGGSFLNKINRIKNAGYLGYAFETTTSFMAVGLQFYLLSQASWKNVEDQSEFELFLDRSFPGIQNQVRIIYENFPLLDDRNIGRAAQTLDLLIKQYERANDQSITLRLKDLKFYIEYLYLLNQFNNAPTAYNTDLLIDKIMSGPGIKLLHPYGLYRSLQREKKIDNSFQWTANRSIDIPVREGVQLTLRSRRTPGYQAINPEFYLESVSTLEAIPIRNTHGLLYVGNNNDGLVKLRARVKRLNSSAGGIIIIRDNSGNHVQDIQIPKDNKWRDYELKLTPNKFYKIQFKTPGAEMFLQGPNRPFVFTEPLYTKYLYKEVPFYFRVPENRKTFQIQIPAKSNNVLIKTADQTLYSQNENDKNYIVDITNEKGQTIEVRTYRHGLKLIGIPQLIGLHPQGVIYQTYNE